MGRISARTKRIWTLVYATLLTLAMAAGEVAFVFFYARNRAETAGLAFAVLGFFCSWILASVLHELGHIVFAKINGMSVAYTKFFLFRFVRTDGKLRFSLASPFSPEETQAIPVRRGNMRRRTAWYTAGGLTFGTAFALIVAGLAVGFHGRVELAACATFAALPYALYMVLLNAIPASYASGKTDAAVLRGILKGYDEEKTTLAAMEIHGRLCEGERFSEIDESLYFDLPQLPEDAPAYAMIVDLRYRYYLDLGDEEKAADQLNRLTIAAPYLTEREIAALTAELTYQHALRGDRKRAEESGKLCEEYLAGETAVAKRALAAYSLLCGKTAEAESLLGQGEKILEREFCAGVKRSEKALFARLEKKLSENLAVETEKTGSTVDNL